jgi:hypothetical protein
MPHAALLVQVLKSRRKKGRHVLVPASKRRSGGKK